MYKNGMSVATSFKPISLAVTFIFTFFVAQPAYSVVVTSSPGDDNMLIYSGDQSLLFNIQEFDLANREMLMKNSLANAGRLQLKIGDLKVLQFIAGLFDSKDDRAPLALANYLKRYPEDLMGFYMASIELFGKKRYPQAELALKNILQSEPEFTAARTLLGITQMMENQYDLAVENLRLSMASASPDPLALRYLALDSVRRGDVRQAKRYMQRNLKSVGLPTDLAQIVHLELAELYRQLGEYQEIVVLFTALANNSEADMTNQFNLEAISRLFEAATAIGDIQNAFKAQQKLESTPAYQAFPTLIARARLFALEQQVNKGIELLQTLKPEPIAMQKRLQLELARLYQSAGKNEPAMVALEHYLSLFGEEVDNRAIEQYTQMAISLGKGNQALSNLKKAYQKDKNNTQLGLMLAETLLSANDLTSATAILDELIAKNPNNSGAYYFQGVIKYNQQDNDAAEKLFRKSVDIQPQNEDAWLALMGTVHDHRNHSHASGSAMLDHESMLPLFEEAISHNPDSFKLHYELGITAYSGGDVESAKKAFDNALVLAPFSIPAMVMSVIVRADMGVDLEKARKIADVVLELAPQNAAVKDAIGWIMVNTDQSKEGLEYLQQALQGMEGDAAVQMHLGVGYFNLQEYSTAKSYLIAGLTGELPSHIATRSRELLNRLNPTKSLTVNANLINGFGTGDEIGSITFTENEQGLAIKANLSSLPPGFNGMHIHERPTCDASIVEGKRVAGAAAGDHYGHDHMMMGMDMDMSDPAHIEHMKSMKPKGDLDPLETQADGTSQALVYSSKLTLSELRGRSIMIHNGPDVDGQSGPKVACAVID